MAIRRTREDKIRVQQRREEEKFQWKEEPTSKGITASRKDSVEDESLSQEQHWLRKDLLQTLIAILVVCILLSYFFWRSLQ